MSFHEQSFTITLSSTHVTFPPKHPPDEYARNTYATGKHFGTVVHATNIYATQGITQPIVFWYTMHSTTCIVRSFVLCFLCSFMFLCVPLCSFVYFLCLFVYCLWCVVMWCDVMWCDVYSHSRPCLVTCVCLIKLHSWPSLLGFVKTISWPISKLLKLLRNSRYTGNPLTCARHNDICDP